MKSSRQKNRRLAFFAAAAAAAVLTLGTSGCGSSGSAKSSTVTGGGGGGNGGGGGGAAVANTQTITVNTGPAASPPTNEPFVNGSFTSVKVCAPGTSTCQTVSGILVDTGSAGLRILSSALTVQLPQQTNSAGNPIVECLQFLDSITWGPVEMADVTLAGEVAKSLPVQVIGTAQFPNIPMACSSSGPPKEDLAGLGANGLLGVGNFAQDCGTACTVTGPANPGLYYACPASGCAVTEESVANQVKNPVALFETDNNGVVIQLPAVTGAEASVSGTMTFGIGTQSDNALGSATVFTIDPNTGDFTTTFKNTTVDKAFLDTGSNGIFFLTSSVTGLPECTDMPFFYCPTMTQSLSAVTKGSNGATMTVNFTVANADSLTANVNNAALQGLAGPISGLFDWGLPFFYGRTVFVAIEGKSTPGGTGPFWAF